MSIYESIRNYWRKFVDVRLDRKAERAPLYRALKVSLDNKIIEIAGLRGSLGEAREYNKTLEAKLFEEKTRIGQQNERISKLEENLEKSHVRVTDLEKSVLEYTTKVSNLEKELEKQQKISETDVKKRRKVFQLQRRLQDSKNELALTNETLKNTRVELALTRIGRGERASAFSCPEAVDELARRSNELRDKLILGMAINGLVTEIVDSTFNDIEKLVCE